MTTSSSPWVLASASPRRAAILRGLGMDFEVAPSSLREPPPRPGESPSAYAVRVARLKVRDVASGRRSGLVVGADTIVVAGRRVLGKPASRSEAAAMLRALSGRWHDVISGIALFDCDSGRISSAFSCSRVHFRRLSGREIAWYIDTGEYRDKAGAYAVQGHAALFIDRIEGCYFNIVGFPIALFDRICRKMGVDLFSAQWAGAARPRPRELQPRGIAKSTG